MKRYLPLVFFLVASAAGLGLTFIMYRAEEVAEARRFEVVADDAVDRIEERISQHMALLTATNSFFVANHGKVSSDAFRAFVAGLNLNGYFKGIQGVGFARLLPSAERNAVGGEIGFNYGLKRAVWPETDQGLSAPIVLLEPTDARNRVALGYDMFTEARRREAMRAALAAGEMRASAPIELVQEITEDKQAGFLVYMPFSEKPAAGNSGPDAEKRVSGFVYAPFRAGDLHRAALLRPPHLPVRVETTDTTDGVGSLLFRSERYPDEPGEDGHMVQRSIQVAGRSWTVNVVEAHTRPNALVYWRSFVLGAASLLFAAALAVSIRSRLRAVAATRKVREISEKTIQEKDLMLQEMKHRIKNSIARILAISRQTASSSETIEEFSSSFSARLQAMANAQDMLTRSRWQKADLHELLAQELEQVFGETLDNVSIDGPKVSLDEKTTHALGLVFHELATNAMKYGNMTDGTGGLSVSWTVDGAARSRRLVLDWVERGDEAIEKPSGKGFGTRLIDANVMGELSGTVERAYRESGLEIRIAIPVA
ncbi:MAG: histidine kinase [Hyphomicrobiales bacterium]|nr:MAG: histidine kinase [Hyphomicrobiales bacterium]